MIEIAAGILTIISGIMATLRMRATWMIGIASCLLYIIVFWEAKLQGMLVLQILMIGQSLVGFVKWKKLKIKKLSKNKFFQSLLLFTVLFLPIGAMLYFEAFSWLELTICWLSVFATWLLVKGDPRNWFIWSATNIVSVVLFVDDKLYVSAATFSLLFINSIYASWKWHKKRGSTASC